MLSLYAWKVQLQPFRAARGAACTALQVAGRGKPLRDLRQRLLGFPTKRLWHCAGSFEGKQERRGQGTTARRMHRATAAPVAFS